MRRPGSVIVCRPMSPPWRPITRDATVAGSRCQGAEISLLTFVSYSKDADELAPSQVIRLTPNEEGEFSTDEVFLSDGSDLSGSSVAARHGDRLLIGSVFDPRFLDCRLAR